MNTCWYEDVDANGESRIRTTPADCGWDKNCLQPFPFSFPLQYWNVLIWRGGPPPQEWRECPLGVQQSHQGHHVVLPGAIDTGSDRVGGQAVSESNWVGVLLAILRRTCRGCLENQHTKTVTTTCSVALYSPSNSCTTRILIDFLWVEGNKRFTELQEE